MRIVRWRCRLSDSHFNAPGKRSRAHSTGSSAAHTCTLSYPECDSGESANTRPDQNSDAGITVAGSTYADADIGFEHSSTVAAA